MRLLNLLPLFVFAITAHAAPAAGKPKDVGRSEKKGRSISPTKARKLKVPLPPISDRCTALPTAGEWVVFTGSIPVRIQLGGATVLLGTQTRLPAAAVWRRNTKKQCWTTHDLFPRPTGKAALTLKAAKGTPAKGRISAGGKKITVSLSHDYKGAHLDLSLGDDSSSHSHPNTIDWALPKPDGMSAEDGMEAPLCFGEASGRATVAALRGGVGLWLWLRCEGKQGSERALLRYNPNKNELDLLYDERRWALDHTPGCSMCESKISQVIRRSWLDYNHALVYRDESIVSTGANHDCEYQCGGGCTSKACVAKCRRKAKAAAARLDRRCRRSKRKLRRWELIKWNEEQGITARAVLRRLK